MGSCMIYEKHSDKFLGTLGISISVPRAGETINIKPKKSDKKSDVYLVREVVHYLDVNEVTVRVYVEKQETDRKSTKHYLLSGDRLKRIAKVVREAQSVVKYNAERCRTSASSLSDALEKLTPEDAALCGISED